jgi:hypothetical protein
MAKKVNRQKMNRRKFLEFSFIGGANLISLVLSRPSKIDLDSKNEMIQSSADSTSELISIWLNGVEVSDDCTAAFMPKKSGIERFGWCDVLSRQPDGDLVWDENYTIIVNRIYGQVKWLPMAKKVDDNGYSNYFK